MAQQPGRTSKSGKTVVSLDFYKDNGIVLGLQAVNDRAPINLRKYMERRAIEVENYMKANHPWRNRTGRAERGLCVDIVDNPNFKQIRMELKHSDVVWPWYGYYLEYGTGNRSGKGSGNARPYPILGPTRDVFGPRLLNELNLSELYRFAGNPKK